MKNNKILIIMGVIITIVFIIYCIASIVNPIIRININKYEIGKEVFLDIDNDGKNENIKLDYSGIIINGKTFRINDDQNDSINIGSDSIFLVSLFKDNIISLGIADLNLDNKFELLVCTSNNSYSPSYRKWKIYKYENESLTFIDEIYDGKITYNKSTNKIEVTYDLYETYEPMQETVSYDIKF